MASVTTWSNGDYRIDTEYTVSQNPKTNKSIVTATRILVTSLTSYHSFFHYNCNGGLGVNGNNGAQDVGSITCPVGGNTGWINLNDKASTISHDVAGNARVDIYGMFNARLGGQNNSPSGVWGSARVGLPKIDRGAGVCTVTLKEAKPFSAIFDVSSNVGSAQGRYRVNGAVWYYFAMSSDKATVTVNNLQEETDYKIEFETIRNYNDVWSSEKTINIRTLSDQKTMWIKVLDLWKKGKLFIKLSGQWKKAKAVYEKIDGEWKKGA